MSLPLVCPAQESSCHPLGYLHLPRCPSPPLQYANPNPYILPCSGTWQSDQLVGSVSLLSPSGALGQGGHLGPCWGPCQAGHREGTLRLNEVTKE